MDKRQLILLGAGLLMGALAIGSIAARRAQESSRAAPQGPPAARPRGPDRIQIGGFTLRGEVGGEAELLGPDGRAVVKLQALADAQVAPAVELFQHEVVILADQRCAEPCPTTAIVVATMGDGGGVVFTGAGKVTLQQVERGGVPALLLDYTMAGSSEQVTLPFALNVDHYERAYRRYPEGVDRQLENLARASLEDCQSPRDRTCVGELRAMLALAMFANDGWDPSPGMEALRLSPEVRLRLEDAELRKSVKEELEVVLAP